MANNNVGTLIRERRSQRGITVQDLATRASVSKSYLSMIESGKRAPTVDQLSVFSRELDLPEELLRLSAGRLPEDVEEALSSRAATITAYVRQDTERTVVELPRTVSPETLLEMTNTKASAKIGQSFAGDVLVGKNTTSYRAHSYHTKVPPEAIEPLLLHFTRKNDLVVDPFCGSGMTGVAALRTGRHALLSDLSPAAVHISRNYLQPCDPKKLELAARRVFDEVRPTIAWLYDIVSPAGNRVTVEYTTWSDKFACPHCGSTWTYWSVLQKFGDAVESQSVPCLNCRKKSRKQDLIWAGEEPVLSTVSSLGNRMDHHVPTREELELIAQAQASTIPYWVPKVPFGNEREMWRASHTAMGVDSVAGFYSARNLHALAAIRHSILKEPDERLRAALLFAFTAVANRASRRYQWNAKRPTNVMTGTLYISSIRYEWNVWSLFNRKLADVVRYYQQFPQTNTRAEAVMASATKLDHIPDHVADFVFMDPPFGSNIFYADSSLLWEAWLGELTEDKFELVVNKHLGPDKGGKTIDDYKAGLTAAFVEARRILKPQAYAALLFSNTDDSVWETVQSALQEAGFRIDSTHVLDKTHRSIKGVKGESGQEKVTRRDLLMCLKQSKTVGVALKTMSVDDLSTLARETIRLTLSEKGESGASTDELYAAVVKRLVAQHIPLIGVTMPFITNLCDELGIKTSDGKWQKDVGAKGPYQKVGSPFGVIVEEYLAKDIDAILTRKTKQSSKVHIAPRFGQVVGSRNTWLYNAHSYHTKVPPEAIVPFIEHFTSPGDVILDPFGGSGMTGVAAAMTGRKAILNDLCAAAAHLSYNHTRECDPDALSEAFDKISKKLDTSFRDIYSTTHTGKQKGYVQYTLWSKVYSCTECRKKFSLWETVDKESGTVGRTIQCPRCDQELKRSGLKCVDNVPVSISYEVTNAGKTERFERAPTAKDLAFIKTFTKEDIKSWYPVVPISDDREMYIRCALHLQQIHQVSDFYTPRNLLTLSLLWKEIQKVSDPRIKHALSFAFTNTAWHGTRMRRFNARGGMRPLTGTLYVPQLSCEVNVLEVFRNKISQLRSYYTAFQNAPGTPEPAILLGSATNLRTVPDASIDYVFTDPPFGSNLFYADCNLIWEAWLGAVTDGSLEAVVNRSLRPQNGGKTLQQYEDLMTGALRELHRVLKPSGWVTLVFHNTDAAVWSALQKAAEQAGFEMQEADSLARQQQSHKGYKGRSGLEKVAHFDVVMNLQKRQNKTCTTMLKVSDTTLRETVDQILMNKEAKDNGFQWVHSNVVRDLVTKGFDLSTVSFERVKKVWEEATSRKSRWTGRTRK
ncbi:MAG: helix-turn-helix domain-containing protein [Candidatus Obscuribacterales bacterium]|nr:helix-turn-helix domain-containing protein [Candidatus Obscuribacterales bacterium]MBY0552054.1 helix-turn-helix domain-containing protein [Candidatus Obscuribacterales bacterium]